MKHATAVGSRARGVVIVKIVEDWNMTYVHELREKYMYSLAPGQAVLALNSARTMSRIIDSQGNSLASYAPEGEEFDVEAILKYVHAGLCVNFEVSPKALPKPKSVRKAA